METYGKMMHQMSNQREDSSGSLEEETYELTKEDEIALLILENKIDKLQADVMLWMDEDRINGNDDNLNKIRTANWKMLEHIKEMRVIEEGGKK